VGSLYINRGTTGAMMKRHPFGGFKMSGVGSKSMGQDYLPQFMYCRTIIENTFRSGFAPMKNAHSES
jgi:RHH-type proline utilization regulon transcriptional repressor/proline dehydrogenase/delta 1-pyrroline-5-carboxylate dehydrogenase